MDDHLFVNFIVSFMQAVSQNVAEPEDDLQEVNANAMVVITTRTARSIS